ncbi:type I polyketide synthase, partial [Wenjunlia tyrosinilytica]|uniref:type I polyketide synthase n=1 Tax=Wenjunlia tyrosinilytica TaxID=1544741 RepID=UPI001668C1B5
VVLKRLSDALRDGDSIRAVVRGSAVNNDGSDKVGFTAPSVRGQAGVIFEAQQVAGVGAGSIGYVEAHGTGTSLGDPIEVAALTEAFRESSSGVGFCGLGSVKTNVGHLDTAAGIAGFIKAVLCVERGLIPASLNFRVPNPRIDFEGSPFFVNSELREWSGPLPRRAGVSSFGMGGTNCHVVVEEPPVVSVEDVGSVGWEVVVASAKSAGSLAGQRTRLAGFLGADLGGGLLSDVAFTSQVGRGEFEHRAAVVGRVGGECAEGFGGGAALVTGRARGDARVAFVFGGQGAQRLGMGRELFARDGVFRGVMERCSEVVRAELGVDLCGVLFGEGWDSAESAALLGETWVQQPALFSVQLALAEQWRAWGVEPCAVVGHSLGEVVAGALAGVWSLRDAVRLVCWRGDLMQRLGRGAMVAVDLGEAEAEEFAVGGCVVAVVNGPRRTVLSGPVEAIEPVEVALAERGVRCRRLATSHAFHSPMMDPMLGEFERRLSGVEFRAPRVRLVSAVTGGWLTGEQAVSASYWAGQVRSAVRFSAGVERLLADEPGALLLEVGPGASARVLVEGLEAASGRVVVSSMGDGRGVRDDVRASREALARLWVNGVAIDWAALHEGRTPRRVPMPTYAFDTKRYW